MLTFIFCTFFLFLSESLKIPKHSILYVDCSENEVETQIFLTRKEFARLTMIKTDDKTEEW